MPSFSHPAAACLCGCSTVDKHFSFGPGTVQAVRVKQVPASLVWAARADSMDAKAARGQQLGEPRCVLPAAHGAQHAAFCSASYLQHVPSDTAAQELIVLKKPSFF